MLDEKTLEDIHKKVCGDIEKIWNNKWAPIENTYCTRCPGSIVDKMKTRCITNVFTMESLCPECWARQREAEIIKEVEEMRKPKLDVADFAKI